MTTTTYIDRLIDQAARAEAEAEAAAEAERRQEIATARDQTMQALADAGLSELMDHSTGEPQHEFFQGNLIRVAWRIERPDLAELYVVWTSGGVHLSQYHRVDYGAYTHTYVHHPDAVARFLLERRRTWEERQADKERQRQYEAERERDGQIYNLRGRLLYANSFGAQTPAEADEALAQLVNLDPSRKEEWLGLREDWNELYRHEQECQAEVARLREIEAGYRAAYAGYVATRNAILAQNRAKLARLQERLAQQTFRLHHLTYGLVAVAGDDEEDAGETYIDTVTVAVLESEPDEAGYWTTVDRITGELKRLRFYHPISLSEPVEYAPDQYNYSPRLAVEHTYRSVYCSPIATKEDIEAEIAALGLTPLPEPPQEPDELERWRIGDIKREIEDGSEA